MIVMGVSARPGEELFFGNTATQVLKGWKRPILLMASRVMKPGRIVLRSRGMKLAILASMIFVAGLWSGLTKSAGPLPNAPQMQESTLAAPAAHPVLTRVAGVFKLRL